MRHPNWTAVVSTPSSAGSSARDRDQLSDDDKSILGQARPLAGVSGPSAVRAYFGTTVVSNADAAYAYAEAFGRATWVIGKLLAIIERLAEPGAGVTVDSDWDELLVRSQSGSGAQAEVIPASPAMASGGVMRTQPCAYEITFTGRAGDTLRAAFDDCTVTLGPDTTTVCAQLPEPAALWGLIQRITGLGLELVDLHLVAPEAGAGSV
jgi:hypothetical protein